VGLLLFSLSSIILIPFLYRLLEKKLNNGFFAGLIILSLFIVFAVSTGIWQLGQFFKTPDINKGIPIITFEEKLNKMTNPCFTAFDKCFAKSVTAKETQCALINEALTSCSLAYQEIDYIETPEKIDAEQVILINDIKIDAKNSLKNFENVFDEYNKQCNSGSSDANKIKLELVSAVKNKYLLDMKIKKLKTLVGLD
jgi:hypothetical protein